VTWVETRETQLTSTDTLVVIFSSVLVVWRFFREEMEQMREVPFISDWIKEGWQEGLQEGLQEGRQEGYAQACREDIISLLEAKFLSFRII